MPLTFGGAGADGAPTDQIGDILGLIRSRNSVPAGSPMLLTSSSSRRARCKPLLI